MKHKLLTVALLTISSIAFSQTRNSLWNSTTKKSDMIPLESRMVLPENHLFTLNLDGLRNVLVNAPQRAANTRTSQVTLTIPNENGILERYSIYENSALDPALSARYPEIKSYIGIGIDNPTSTSYFSVTPLGFKAMTLNADKAAVFIEPISQDLTTYAVYRKIDKAASLTPFECQVIDEEVEPMQ